MIPALTRLLPLFQGLDKTKLEQYLSEEEFKKVLQMSKEEFYALPAWKQNKVRQQIGLY